MPAPPFGKKLAQGVGRWPAINIVFVMKWLVGVLVRGLAIGKQVGFGDRTGLAARFQDVFHPLWEEESNMLSMSETVAAVFPAQPPVVVPVNAVVVGLIDLSHDVVPGTPVVEGHFWTRVWTVDVVYIFRLCK